MIKLKKATGVLLLILGVLGLLLSACCLFLAVVEHFQIKNNLAQRGYSQGGFLVVFGGMATVVITPIAFILLLIGKKLLRKTL